MRGGTKRIWAVAAALLLIFGLAAWGTVELVSGHGPDGGGASGPTDAADAARGAPGYDAILPAPVSATATPGVTWTLASDAAVFTDPGSAEAAQVGELLASLLRPATGYVLPVREFDANAPPSGIALVLEPDGPDGAEGYRLTVTADAVEIRAARTAGLRHGVQTLRQLLPVSVESKAPAAGPWTVPGGSVVDRPRYAYRGMMLDIVRQYFAPADVRRLVDDISRYKFNHLHLRMTDDQGWRIAIDGLPRLSEVGGATQVGGGPGGFWTQQDYREVVAYAAERGLTLVPEIALPGHTGAALVAYPELGCDGREYEPYTGIDVGFSTLCVESGRTYEFVDRVVGQVAALTPGPYVHIGGDEAHTLKPEQFAAFMRRAQEIVGRHGKTVMAWHQLADVPPVPGAVVQYWNQQGREADMIVAAARAGAKVVLSPSDRVYLDMKYDGAEKLGLTWAGTVDVRQSYDWDPATLLAGVPEDAVIGVEAPLWSETLDSFADVEHMAFPRVAGVAEIGWSVPEARGWDRYRARLAAQLPRWDVAGIAYARRDLD
ncbi:beta-N-acetylhexosaminidase [Yinghuangia sp. YIM S09857]|uniref:beta-N-acetylhexosaminidase n=1 Tax=Yinghuangia sp. YIM S09857 TaxID=3436929 RepID=UPI003F53C652